MRIPIWRTLRVGALGATAGLFATGINGAPHPSPVVSAAPLAVRQEAGLRNPGSGVTVTPSASSITVGQTLTLTATSPDASAWYQFWVRTPLGQWRSLGPYAPDPRITVTLAQPGPYLFVVFAAPARRWPIFWPFAHHSAPVLVTATPATTAPSSRSVTLTGTINHGAILLPVTIAQKVQGQWITIQGQALVDTGNEWAVSINGTALSQAGGIASGTASGIGFGGSFSTAAYDHIWVIPTADPHSPLLADQPNVPGGVGRMDQQLSGSATSPFVADIGLPLIDQGTFTIHGSSWTWTYTPAPISGPPAS